MNDKMKKENKVRVSVTKEIMLISTEKEASAQTRFVPGEEVRLTASEIFEHMSIEPTGMMPLNPTAPSLSDEEKVALDELFSLFKDAAIDLNNIIVAKNCLEILFSPFGLLHPRRNESIDILKKATKIPELASFANTLIIGSKDMLNGALLHRCTDEETKCVARDLLEKMTSI